MNIKKVILIPNEQKDDGLRIARRVIHRLTAKGAEVYIDKAHTDLYWEEAQVYEKPPKDADLCLVMGGDGTFLDNAPFAVEHGIPLVGINLGRLGYLAVVEADKLSMLDRLFRKTVTLSERMLLEGTVHRCGGETHTVGRAAVNDIAIMREGNAGLPDFSVSDSSGNVINYRADGVIFATPSGSSAYSLSAGGPLLNADVEAVCMTPVCCHSFFSRSVIFGPGSAVTVGNTSERGISLELLFDGRAAAVLKPGDEVTVRKSDRTLKTVDFSERGMLTTLRRKMEAAELRHEN